MRRKISVRNQKGPHEKLLLRIRSRYEAGVVLLGLVLSGIAALTGCGGSPAGFGGGGGNPGEVVVAVQPATASVLLAATQQFQGVVTGTSNTAVTWSVNGIPSGNATVGTISSSGLYTAPGILPANSQVTVTATSVSDTQANASAAVLLTDDISVSISPPFATVPAAAAQVFTATVTGAGEASGAVSWSVNGIAGGNSTVGTIIANGNDSATYSAPTAVPSPANVTVTASSVADNAKVASAAVTVTCSANSLAPSTSNVSLGATETFRATFCTVSGGAIVWDVDGIVGGNSVDGTIASTGANSAVYAAPADLPSLVSVAIHATESTAVVSATVTVTSAVTINVSPPSATIGVTQGATFAATVTNTPDTTVTWTVNGVLNGSPAVGEICITGSNPCVAPNGPVSGDVDYIAPTAIPNSNPVTLTATSKADPSQSASAFITITGSTGTVAVAVSPSYAFVAPSAAEPSTAQFFATVANTANNGVTWTVQSAVSGQGCGGAACGSVDANGIYTAPAVAPSPNAISIIATSAADATKSASATIAITSGPTIEVLLPSSVMAGAVGAFPLEVQGENFVAGSGPSASAIFLDGDARATTCATAMSCVTELNPEDVQSAETLTVQIQNPGAPGALSNPVPFVIVPFDVSFDSIGLAQSAPAATNQDIIVTDPTTSASSAPINIEFIGFLTNGNSCGVQGSPLTVTRPASGTEVVSLCVDGNDLDPTFTYAFTGPNGGDADISVVASAINGLFPNMIELDLTISATTQPGVRSLFITTLNNDRAVATGMLEVD